MYMYRPRVGTDIMLPLPIDGVFRALVVVSPPVEVELEDLIVSAEQSSSQEAGSGSQGRRGVKLLNESSS